MKCLEFDSFLKYIVDYILVNMVDNLSDKIVKVLSKKEECCTQQEIKTSLRTGVDRAILLGYLRCLVDIGKIQSKQMGKAKGYFIK